MKPISKEVVYQTPWFQLEAKTMTPGEPPYYSLRLYDYVAIIAITADQRVLAVRQYRPAVEQYTIELPAGMVDAGEDPVETARRELLEETGYSATHVENLGGLLTDNGRLHNRIFTCFATGLSKLEGHEPEAGIETLTYSVPELLAAVRSGEFDHSLHMGSVLAAAALGKLTLGI